MAPKIAAKRYFTPAIFATPPSQKPSPTANSLNYTVLLDKGQMPAPFGLQRIYSTTGIPAAFFITAEGTIKAATVGTLDKTTIKNLLAARAD